LATWPLVPTLPASIFRQPIASAALLQAQPDRPRLWVDEDFAYTTTFDKFFKFSGFGPPDPGYWLTFKETLVPDLGIYAGLPSANNNDPLVVGRWQQLTDALAETTPEIKARLLGLMHAAYFLAEAPPPDWPIVYQDGQMQLQQLPETLPRAYFVPEMV